MVARKRQNQPDTDICKRCGKEITDRHRLGFGELWYCKTCQTNIIHEKNHKIYRKYHPKKLTKQELNRYSLTKDTSVNHKPSCKLITVKAQKS